jgi:hypothetical protein
VGEAQPASGPGPVGTGAGTRRFRWASPLTAAFLGGLVLTLLLAGLPLSGLAHQFSLSAHFGDLIVLVSAGVAVVVARHQPANPVGWMMLASAGLLAATGDASYYSVADYRLHHGTLPFGPVAVLAQPTWAPAIALVGVAVLLFPDGRVPSPRWRPVLVTYLVVGVAWCAGAFGLAASAIIGHGIRMDSGGNLLIMDRPSGGAAWWGVVEAAFFVMTGLCWLAWLVSQVSSWRRSSGERRQQLKWVMAGAAVCLVGLGPASLLGGAAGLWGVVGTVGTVCILALPVSMGVAILKYRLYDIDRIISRTLAYAILTGLLVGVYAGLVLLATQVLGFHGTVAVAAATLAAAALFSPLRRWVQRAVDRRFNRARYDADQTVAAFAAGLKEAVDLDSIRHDLAGTVHQALEPAHVSVWVSRR